MSKYESGRRYFCPDSYFRHSTRKVFHGMINMASRNKIIPFERHSIILHNFEPGLMFSVRYFETMEIYNEIN